MTGFVPTAEQSAIISYPQVPLRVVAGAGTGKTTTIVNRLADTVASGGDPTRALGITFTNKAADELRTKLREAVGDRPDGREVEVATYHSFASSVLDEFGAFVGYQPTASLMDDGHRTELAYRVLQGLDATDLDLSSLSQRKDDLLAMSEALTSNLLKAADVIALAPNDPDDVWVKRVALAEAADRFAEAKHQLGFFEYSDLIALAVRIVEGFPTIAEQIAGRYDTVLLDEYQDTDPAQRRLLTAVFAGGTAVTAVGDSDQTIYEWRGASLENFSDFPRHFPRADGIPTETLPLSVNRRSDRLILDLANEIQTLLPRLEGSKPLRPGPDAAAGVVEVGWFATGEDEAEWIASEIADKHREGRPWSDIAVLCRKRSTIPSIVRALRAYEIPFSVSSMGELLTIPEVADLLAWLKVLADPGDETALLRIWMGGYLRIGMRDISRLVRWCSRRDGCNLGSVIDHLDDVEGISATGRERLERYATVHARLLAMSQVLPVSGAIGLVVDELGIWDEVAALPQAAATTARVNVSRFVSIATAWRPLDGKPTLAAFLRYIAALDDAQSSGDLDAAVEVADSVVQVITAHSAKGLEWPVVFLPALTENTFPSGVRAHDDPAKRAMSLPYELRLDSASFAEADRVGPGKERTEILRTRHTDSEWRLAYVAVTRAKHELVMTGHAWSGDVSKARTPSPLLTIATDLDGSLYGPWNDDPGPRPLPVAYEEPPASPDPHFDGGWDSALRSRIGDRRWVEKNFPDMVDAVEERRDQLIMQLTDLSVPSAAPEEKGFATSVTNLVALAQCPAKFKWIHHDRLPRRPGVAARLGTEFHRRVEMHNLGVATLGDPSTDDFDRGHREGAGEAAPRQDPWDAFESSRFSSMRARFAEVPFILDIGEGSVRGKIDAIYTDDGGTWEIVDYKSGRPSDDEARNVQLEAYALAIEGGAVSINAPESMSVTFAYFGGGTCVEVTTPVDGAWLSKARSHVESLIEQAVDGPFEPAPSPDCRYCDFLHLCRAGQDAVKDPG